MLVYECLMIMLMLCKSSYARLTPEVLHRPKNPAPTSLFRLCQVRQGLKRPSHRTSMVLVSGTGHGPCCHGLTLTSRLTLFMSPWRGRVRASSEAMLSPCQPDERGQPLVVGRGGARPRTSGGAELAPRHWARRSLVLGGRARWSLAPGDQARQSLALGGRARRSLALGDQARHSLALEGQARWNRSPWSWVRGVVALLSDWKCQRCLSILPHRVPQY